MNSIIAVLILFTSIQITSARSDWFPLASNVNNSGNLASAVFSEHLNFQLNQNHLLNWKLSPCKLLRTSVDLETYQSLAWILKRLNKFSTIQNVQIDLFTLSRLRASTERANHSCWTSSFGICDGNCCRTRQGQQTATLMTGWTWLFRWRNTSNGKPGQRHTQRGFLSGQSHSS